ncbi:MAG TPA: hypothetical protein V6C81_20630 [Planktothrix sp.]|jgi:hypothetical protein
MQSDEEPNRAKWVPPSQSHSTNGSVDLLLKAGVISQAQLDEGVRLASSKRVQVGQMLIMAGYITPRDLHAAIDAQSALRDRTLTQGQAVMLLKIACKTGRTFEDVQEEEAIGGSTGTTNQLGELLLEAGFINRDQYGKSMRRSLATGLPLGRTLVLSGALHDSILTMALELQIRIRDGMHTREEAIADLAAAAGTELSSEKEMRLDSITSVSARRKGVRLGELLVLSEFLNETDVMNALELGLMQDTQIGQVLISQGFITEEVLEAALKLQARIRDGQIEPLEAAKFLRRERFDPE